MHFNFQGKPLGWHLRRVLFLFCSGRRNETKRTYGAVVFSLFIFLPLAVSIKEKKKHVKIIACCWKHIVFLHFRTAVPHRSMAYFYNTGSSRKQHRLTFSFFLSRRSRKQRRRESWCFGACEQVNLSNNLTDYLIDVIFFENCAL